MSMTQEEELKELALLKDCVEDMGLTAELVPQAGKQQSPAMKITLFAEDPDKTCILVCSFLPLDDTQSKFVKYLQMYMELEAPLPDVQMPIALLLMNQINQILVVGQCFWRMEDEEAGLPGAIGIRYTLPTPIEQPVDEGCFGESLILMADAFGILDEILESAKDPEKAKELLVELNDIVQDSVKDGDML